MMMLPAIGGIASAVSSVAAPLQFGLTAASALSSIASGKREAAAAEAQGRMVAAEERLAGESEALKLQAQLNQTIGQSLVAYAASGTDTVGSPAAMARWQSQQTDQQIGMTRRSAQIRAMQAQIRARQSASSSRAEGIAGAIGTLGNFAGSIINRG